MVCRAAACMREWCGVVCRAAACMRDWGGVVCRALACMPVPLIKSATTDAACLACFAQANEPLDVTDALQGRTCMHHAGTVANISNLPVPSNVPMFVEFSGERAHGRH